jgi:cob(I)alamin adenosyltransferase
MRALGRGWKVLIVMFAKGGNDYGELFAFRELSPEIKRLLTIEQAGLSRIVYAKNVTEEDRIAIKKGWETAKNSAKSGDFDMIVLDEINIAVSLEIIPLEEMIKFLRDKPTSLEIVLTGRHAHNEIIKTAHLVSEICPLKHYWDIGVTARKGIEY